MGLFFCSPRLRKPQAFIIILTMSETIDVNQLDTLPPLNTKQEEKPWKKPLHIALQILMVLLFAVVFSVSTQITYDYSRYQKFYVNGESMYPTFNAQAEVYDSEGKRCYVNTDVYRIGNFGSLGYRYLCDYGLMDDKTGFLNEIERFSIVVTYYNEDFFTKGDGTHTLKDGAELKIKRVIGLPGETLYFDGDGNLYVKGADENGFSSIAQPFLEINPWDTASRNWSAQAKAQTISGANYANGSSHPITLGNDEYFLCGDNRIKGCSKDSRSVGPVHSYAFLGRVVTIIGKCWYTINQDGTSNEQVKWNSVIMPWNLQYL